MSINRWRRRRMAAALAAPCALFLGMNGAFASTGCSAVNGGIFNFSTQGGTANVSQPGFSPGDVINVSVTSGDSLHYSLTSNGSPVIAFTHPANGSTFTATLGAGQTTVDLSVFDHSFGAVSVTTTCVAAPTAANTESASARAMQIIGSAASARTSGQAVSDAVTDAIGRQLNGPAVGQPVQQVNAPSGLGGPGRQALPAQDAEGAARGFGIAGVGPGVSVWSDVRGTSVQNREDRSNGLQGDQLNVTSGVGVRLWPGVVAGLLGGYEHFDYKINAISGQLKGNGSTGGAYFGARLGGGLRLDLLGAYARIAYEGGAGQATGGFDANRWLVSGAISANIPAGLEKAFFEPSISLTWLKESQEAWVDTLGSSQDGRSFKDGRLSLGSKFGTTLAFPGGALTPHIGAYADYYFGGERSLPSGLDGLGINDGWSMRVVGGVTASFDGGHALSLGATVGGIGDDNRTTSVRGSYSIQF